MDQEILRVLKTINEGINKLDRRVQGVQEDLEKLSASLVNHKDDLVEALRHGT